MGATNIMSILAGLGIVATGAGAIAGILGTSAVQTLFKSIVFDLNHSGIETHICKELFLFLFHHLT